jgi:Predicted membrane protein|tara:strand:+ start:764 stop:1075 length:312 start_codon:yes stop_codon:yes gene_type:complete
MNFILDILGLSNLSFSEFLWISFGTFGQLIFFSRWIVQWFYSEKNKSSVIPIAFWWCSLIGGIITLIYAYHIGSFPFMLAQAIGIIVYLRNLLLIYKSQYERN